MRVHFLIWFDLSCFLKIAFLFITLYFSSFLCTFFAVVNISTPIRENVIKYIDIVGLKYYNINKGARKIYAKIIN